MNKNSIVLFLFKDTLPKTIRLRQFCFCNTDTQSGKGKHWLCFIRSHKNYIELFDSLGINSEKNLLIKNYCKFNVKEIVFNESQFQESTTNSCGLYVLYFAIERMHNLDMSFEEILEEIFESNLKDNEQKVKQFCEDIIKD